MTKSGRARHDFLHHSADVTPFGNAVTVATVGASNIVALRQMHAYRSGNRFLAIIYMNKSGDISTLEFNHDTLFKTAYRPHNSISFKQGFFRISNRHLSGFLLFYGAHL